VTEVVFVFHAALLYIPFCLNVASSLVMVL